MSDYFVQSNSHCQLIVPGHFASNPSGKISQFLALWRSLCRKGVFRA